MLFDDTYRTIEKASEGIFKDRGSKFLAYAYAVRNEIEIREHLSKIKKEHHSARHHCYAFRLGPDKLSYRSNDDGEPSGTAGKPILGQIQSNDLTNILIVVVRYFGGTLLGTSGLIHAYKEAAADAIKGARILEKTVNDLYEIVFPYAEMNLVMKILKDFEIQPETSDKQGNSCIRFSVRKNNSQIVYDLLKKISNLEIKYILSA
jgi:uncharacterized YigZ family protein